MTAGGGCAFNGGVIECFEVSLYDDTPSRDSRLVLELENAEAGVDEIFSPQNRDLYQRIAPRLPAYAVEQVFEATQVAIQKTGIKASKAVFNFYLRRCARAWGLEAVLQ